MRVLVACEESQAVCKAFRAKGHEAYSCDLIPCSGGHHEWHIQQDVIPLIPTNNVKEEMLKLPKKERDRLYYLSPSPDRAKIRSRTFPGIAEAMAEQWGGIEDAV